MQQELEMPHCPDHCAFIVRKCLSLRHQTTITTHLSRKLAETDWEKYQGSCDNGSHSRPSLRYPYLPPRCWHRFRSVPVHCLFPVASFLTGHLLLVQQILLPNVGSRTDHFTFDRKRKRAIGVLFWRSPVL